METVEGGLAQVAELEAALREKIEDYRRELENSARLGNQVTTLIESKARLIRKIRQAVREAE